MRGPLLSGPIGSSATLDRLGAILRDRRPIVVLSAVWLAAALAEELPLLLLVEREAQRAAQRALRRAASAGQQLLVVTAGETVPLRPGGVGVFVVEGLAETEPDEAIDFLLGLAESLAPEGLVVALDGTKDPTNEARVAGLFLGAGLRGVAQERPREGALLTLGLAPLPEVLSARRPRGAPAGVSPGVT